MAEQNIPAEMLDAATKAVFNRALELDIRECGDDDCAEIAQAALEAAGVPALVAELAELQTSSDLRWNADQRARERWRAAHPDQPLTWPDHVDLCVWLMTRVTELEAAAKAVTDDAFYVEDTEDGDYYIVSVPRIKKLYEEAADALKEAGE